jgi:predicted AAA+ superfamily ATPase
MTLVERQIDEPSVSLGALVAGDGGPVEGRTAVDLEQYVEEILASGFPGLRGLSSRHRRIQLDGYLTRIVDTDFPELGQSVRRPQGLRRWMAAYAAATATTASYERIRDAATGGEGEKPARSTTLPYRDVLERLRILDPVPAWIPTRSRRKRLAQPPKHHLADPALAARLLGVTASPLLSGKPSGVLLPRDGTLLGGLFESLVTLCVRVFAQAAECSVGHLRTRGGRHEVDLIVERDDQRVIAVEVKLSPMLKREDVAYLRWLQRELGGDLIDAVVVTTGTHATRRRCRSLSTTEWVRHSRRIDSIRRSQ